jgi:hypothetical protein
MEPIHSVEYELSSALATEIQRCLLRWELRRGRWQNVPVFLGTLIFTVLVLWLGLQGWILPAVGGGLLCAAALAVAGAVLRRRWTARAALASALVALHTTDRRVRIEFAEERVRLETEFLRGQGAWTELDDVVVFAGFWVLRLSNGGQVVIPASLISPELEAFIRAKAERVMAPVLRG